MVEHGGTESLEAIRLRRLSRLVLAGLIGVALLNSGCILTGPFEWIDNGLKVGPNYGRPPAPVAEAWIHSANPNVQNRHIHDWWEVFNDPTLDSLIATAYAQNFNLRSLAARVLEGRAQQAIAVGGIFPQTQQAGFSFTQTALSHNTFNNPATTVELINEAGFPLPPHFPIGNFYGDWNTGFNLSWELDLWGRLRRNIESANANLDALVENYDDALVTLLADVATNYVQFRVAQQRIRIARDNVEIQEGILKLAQDRFKVGTATRLDVEQARTVLEQTRSSIPALQIILGQANDTLCILLGIPPRDLEPVLGPGSAVGQNPMPNTPAWVAAGLPADLLRQRPDVRSAERQVAAQSAQIGAAEADLYPTLFINGTLGVETADFSKLFDSKSFFGTIMPAFRWNILNYGRIVNNVHAQEARTQELIAAYQNRVLTAARETQTALRGFLRSQEQAEDLERSVQAAGAATQLGVDQYKTGTVPFNTVFNLETAQVQQRDNLAVAQGNIALNLIAVYRALGGGWEVRLPNGHGADTKLVDAKPPSQDTDEKLPPPRPLAPAK